MTDFDQWLDFFKVALHAVIVRDRPTKEAVYEAANVAYEALETAKEAEDRLNGGH